MYPIVQADSSAIASNRRGFTLLEVLLALALTVVLMVAISGAIHVHLVMLGKQQGRIERQQIARSVLLMVSSDIRAAVQYRPQDYSGLENLAASQSLMAGIAGAAGLEDEGADAGAGAGDAGADAGADGEDAGADDTADGGDEEIDPEAAVTSRPTLIGDSRVLMVDVSRLPRVHEYNPLVATAQSLIQLPSDVKSVGYFHSDQSFASNETFDLGLPVAPGGLYRRSIDRAVAAYNNDEELVQGPDDYTKLVASEVAEMSFRYFDGTDWVTEWDSVLDGGFPTAIEVIVTIDSARVGNGAENYQFAGFDPETMEQFRTVVHLPGAELPPEE